MRRDSRQTPAQVRALSDLWPRYGIEYTGAPRDLDACFGRRAPIVLEIGFGNGEQLAHAAEHEPTSNHLGIEVHRPGIAQLMSRLAERALDNARIYAHDAVDVLEHEIADASLAEARIYFPDPWPKNRQKKRRLVQPAFLALLARRLAPGARLHLATDWQDYAGQMLAVLDASDALRNCSGAGRYAERPPWRILTHFERRGVRLGHDVFDLVYEKR